MRLQMRLQILDADTGTDTVRPLVYIRKIRSPDGTSWMADTTLPWGSHPRSGFGPTYGR